MSFGHFNPQIKRAIEMEEFTKGLTSPFATGEPLDAATRTQMEGFLGHNLEEVRIHHGPEAEEASRQMSARAFTFKTQVFGPRSNLDTHTTAGVGLLAHELTHVIQQTQPGRVPQTHTVKATATPLPALSESYVKADMVLLAPTQNAFPDSSLQSREAQAQTNEQMATEAAADNRSSSPQLDTEALADYCYRLMQRELELVKERENRSGG